MKITDEQLKNMECYPEMIRLARSIRDVLSEKPDPKRPARPLSILRPPDMIRFVASKPA